MRALSMTAELLASAMPVLAISVLALSMIAPSGTPALAAETVARPDPVRCADGFACRVLPKLESASPALGAKMARPPPAVTPASFSTRHLCDDAANGPFNPDTAAISMATTIAMTEQFSVSASHALLSRSAAGMPCGDDQAFVLQHLIPAYPPAFGLGPR